MRGPAVLPHGSGAPAPRSPRERFDDLVLDAVGDIERRWSSRLGLVEYAVEEVPSIPDDWSSGTVPLSSLVRGAGVRPSRIVLFRRPLEHRAESRSDLEALVLTVLVEQVAELLGLPPEDVHPGYAVD
jgi:predicted Zn-dependent protease with MMP-like domain